MLALRATDEQSALVFSSVFFIVWCGAGVITVNSQLLGGKLYVTPCLLCLTTVPQVFFSIDLRDWILYFPAQYCRASWIVSAKDMVAYHYRWRCFWLEHIWYAPGIR
jgi:hypothetical protein